MADSTQIIKLRSRIPDIVNNSYDKLLGQILDDAEQEILDLTNRDVLLPKMLGLQRELAIVYYNRQGAEGILSESQGKMSVSYDKEIPENIKQRLISHRRLKAVGYANKK